MRSPFWITMASALLASVSPSQAAGPSGMVSFDLFNGPAGGETRSALCLGGFAFDRGDVLAGAMRFDDSTVGPGFGLMVGGGASLGTPVSLRVLASRFVGDRDYRAWRLKAGPRWDLPGGTSLGISWVHDANNLGPDTESGSAELSVPMIAAWTGKLSGVYGRSQERDGYAAAIGAAWAGIPHLELGGEVGAARNAPATTAAPSRGLLDPIFGGGPGTQPTPQDELAATTSISLRVTFP